MQRKPKLQLRPETIRVLTRSHLAEAVAGAIPTIILTMTIGDSPPRPPRSNSVSPCCASMDSPCPTE